MTKRKKGRADYGKKKGYRPDPDVYKVTETQKRLRELDLYSYEPMRTRLKVETVREIVEYGAEELGYDNAEVVFLGTKVKRIYGYSGCKRKELKLAELPKKYLDAIDKVLK